MSPTFIIFLLIGIIVFIYANLAPESFSLFSRFTGSQNKYKDSKLVGVLLGLPEHALEELMELYKKEFGTGPARYAKKTYQKWKSGKVQPASRTYERFLVHLPKVMTYDLKCEVLRHFMEEYSDKAHYNLDVFTDDWEEKLSPLVQQIIDKAYTTQLPVEVERKLRWLGEGDMQAAQQILRASQAEEGKIAVASLRGEIDNIEKLLAASDLKPKVTHTLKFPYGDVEMNIKRR
jgi:hypothetical protein